KMNKVIEADFFPRESNFEFSWRGSTASSTAKEKRRILIVDNDRDSTHLVKILLEKTGWYSVLEENDATRAHLSARNLRPAPILLSRRRERASTLRCHRKIPRMRSGCETGATELKT